MELPIQLLTYMALGPGPRSSKSSSNLVWALSSAAEKPEGGLFRLFQWGKLSVDRFDTKPFY